MPQGGEQHPYFPRPLLSEFDFKIPLTSKNEQPEEPNSTEALEETYMRHGVLLSLQQDSAEAGTIETQEQLDISNRENNIDRALLQLLMMACKEEEQGAKALEICGLFRQRRALDMAVKVAVKYERSVLARKIGELRDVMDLED